MKKALFIYVTFPSIKHAQAVANKLLSQHLIACATFHPISSMYRWQGKIEKDKEVSTIFKTTERNAKSVIALIQKNHSYAVPCIAKIPVMVTEKFGHWLEAECCGKK
jgi:periplasmic divalent cation tolerance protein